MNAPLPTGFQASLIGANQRLHIQHGPTDLIVDADGPQRLALFEAAVEAMRAFGAVLDVKALTTPLPELMDHRDKAVREEGAQLLAELPREIQRSNKALRLLCARLKKIERPEATLLYADVMSTRAKLVHATNQWVAPASE